MSPTAPIISSDSGNLTNTTTPSFSGTAEAGTSIEVFADGALLGTTLANSSGRWDFTVPTSAELTDGRIAITAIATDSGVATELEVTPVRPKYPGATNREYRNDFAFAALKEDGSVVTWGDSNRGGNSSSVTRDLSFGVSEIFSNRQAFAALKEDGSVVTWRSR